MRTCHRSTSRCCRTGSFHRLPFTHWYHLLKTMLLVVEYELILIGVWILQLFVFVRYPCNPVSTSVESMGPREMGDEPFPNATEPGELNDEENHDRCPEVKESISVKK